MIKIKPSETKFKKSEIKEFENSTGLKFTQEYLVFLGEYNGGKPEANILELNNDIQSFSITSFFGIGIDANDDIVKQYSLLKKRIPQGCVPIARVEGGNIVCINLSPLKKGQILLWDHEKELLYGEDITIDNLCAVASSFAEFIDKIKPYNIQEQDLSGYKIQEVWIDPDFLKDLENRSED